MIRGFHTIWTKPYFSGNQSNEYMMQDYELITMIMSALMWRKNNGIISMYGDEIALDYIDRLGIAHIWNGGMKPIDVPQNISEKVFWAAGKLYALKQEALPSVMVDMDLIIWKNIEEYIRNTDICVIHREELLPDVYPEKKFFNMADDYVFDLDWNWDVFPANTCLLYLSDEEFRQYYIESAISFMEHCEEKTENLCHMVFAEQRLLAMCAEKKGRVISSFFPFSMDIMHQDIFTHLWGYKNILKYNYRERTLYNEKLLRRIVKEFPEEEETMLKLDIAINK